MMDETDLERVRLAISLIDKPAPDTQGAIELLKLVAFDPWGDPKVQLQVPVGKRLR